MTIQTGDGEYLMISGEEYLRRAIKERKRILRRLKSKWHKEYITMVGQILEGCFADVIRDNFDFNRLLGR